MINKKGIEQPQVIVYVLFVVVLTLAGIYVAFTQLGGVTVTLSFQDYASRLNVASSKLMLTPECYAVEDSYDKDGIHYQVHGGIINWTRFNSSDNIAGTCLSVYQWTEYKTVLFIPAPVIHRAEVWAQLDEINNAYSRTIWTGSKPNLDDWKTMQRSFFVLISKDGKLDSGVLTVRLKE